MNNDSFEISLCSRRVQAPWSENVPPETLTPQCLKSICTSSNGICDQQMNSGDKTECLKCIAGSTSHGPTAAYMANNILTRASNPPFPCFELLHAVGMDKVEKLLLQSIDNTCLNNICTSRLYSMCSDERAQGAKKCAQCVGSNPENAHAAQKAGCTQKDIDAWCQQPPVVESFKKKCVLDPSGNRTCDDCEFNNGVCEGTCVDPGYECTAPNGVCICRN